MAEVQELVQEQTTPEKVTYGGGGAEQAKKPKNSKKRRRLVRRIIALAAVIAVGAGLVKFLGRGGETESTVVTNEVQ